jgi:hypothetical protein
MLSITIALRVILRCAIITSPIGLRPAKVTSRSGSILFLASFDFCPAKFSQSIDNQQPTILAQCLSSLCGLLPSRMSW